MTKKNATKKNITKKMTEDNQILLLVRSGQWQVVEQTDGYISAVRPKNSQDDRIDEHKKLIDQLTKKLRSQDKQMKEQKECICSQDKQIQAQNKLITELQAKWEAQEESLALINQSKETGRFSSGKPAVLMTDICDIFSLLDVNNETFVFDSKIKRQEISAIYTQNTLKNAPSDTWDVSAEKDGSVKAWTCKGADNGTYILYLAGDGDIYANPDSSYLFAKYENLIKADFTHLKTDLVTNMNGMFWGCSQLQTLDVTKWNVFNVADMHLMFSGCSQLQTLNVTKWNVSNVTNMNGMFWGCSQLQTLDVTKWNVSNVADMHLMFSGCSQLQTLDVSNWNVSNVMDMHGMFSSCSAVDHMKKGELSSWKLHSSVNLEDFCDGTKFEEMPTALFQIPQTASKETEQKFPEVQIPWSLFK